MSPAILFAGPTLWGLETLVPAGVEVRPPARAGDLLAALAARPAAIALVDGVFGSAPSVWHKEVLDALDRGIPVLGASSLGALRAAELWSFGMVGVGRVFEAYRDSAEVRDDAVLVAHAPAELGFRPLTIALVDVDAALAASALSPADKARCRRAASRLGYAERTRERLLAAFAAATGLAPAALMSALGGLSVSVKQADCRALLERLSAPLPCPAACDPPRLVRTGHYAKLEALVSAA